MRRAILAVTLGGVLLSAAACSTDSKTPADAAGPAGTTAAATPAADATSEAPDYSADTKKVCDKLSKSIESDVKGFATELGKMMAYKAAKQTAAAAKAQKAAGDELKAWADKIRKTAATAKDPKLKAAGAEAADNMAKSADDKALFAKLKDPKDLDKNLEAEFTAWFVPVGGICG
ncbi:hypothetical protein [Krasilnikovia sp. MM14-A1259]|uniref:hypothetical protein n=1 Tax=Krasilnikovia sp. MM14-A1259 TaxID=3373539 RepID=UPI0038086B21